MEVGFFCTQQSDPMSHNIKQFASLYKDDMFRILSS